MWNCDRPIVEFTYATVHHYATNEFDLSIESSLWKEQSHWNLQSEDSMESEVIQTPSEVKKVDRFGFYEEDTGRSEVFSRALIIEPVFDVKLENQRLHKWMYMLKNWDK